jgi:hypothetical protein
VGRVLFIDPRSWQEFCSIYARLLPNADALTLLCIAHRRSNVRVDPVGSNRRFLYSQREPRRGVDPAALETQGSQVRNFRIRVGVVVAVAAAALVACGGGGSNNSSSVRLVNATLTHTSLSLLANATSVLTADPVDTASAYVSVPSGSPTLQINDSASGAVLATTAPTVGGGQHFALVAYESGGVVRTAVVAEDTTAPVTGTAALRIFDTATDAGAIDVYVTDPAVDITTLSSPTFGFGSSTSVQASAFLSFGPGTYRIRVTGSGNPADLRLDIPSVVLTNQEVATAILTPTIGGTLANGAVLVQQAAYTASRNTSARVRLAAAVSGGATVTATAGGLSIGTGVVAPAIGAYTNVPAGSAISVNGGSIAAPTAALTAGSDTTLLVYGNAGSAVAGLIADDNHLPAVTTNFKVRLINGVTGAAVPLSLDVNFGVVASSIAPGAASSYAVVPAGTAGTLTQIEVISPSSPTAINGTTDFPIPGNSVFTLFMLGDASAPIFLLRKDR